ncbi:hypothetical protein [Parvibaculum sp. MBR-TMA-1.3b-4.2]|jgi:hypothetical protein
MTNRTFGLLIANGALVLLAGFAVGFPYGMVVGQSLDPSVPQAIPGTIRAWRMAHMEGVLNGMLMIAAAAAATKLSLSAAGEKVVFWGLVVSGWTNIVASTLSALTGGRGTGLTGLDWNTLNFLLFAAGIIGAVAAAIALVRAGLAVARRA